MAVFRWRTLRLKPVALLGIAIIAEYVTPWPLAGRTVSLVAALLLTVGFVRDSLRHVTLTMTLRPVLRTRLAELGLTAIALTLLVSKVWVGAEQLGDPARAASLEPVYRQYAGAFFVVALLRLLAGGLTVRRTLHRLDLRPAQTVALGFALAVFAGTLLLSLPLSVSRLEELSLLDAFFTAASAVTVTGLVVYDPGTALAPVGQVILLGLIQLGGLGTMATSASLVILAGRRLRLDRAAALQESMDLQTLGTVRRQLQSILVVTVVVETAGAVTFYLLWRDRSEIAAPAFAAAFHAVSAFCNAGFSTFATNFVAFREDYATNIAAMALIILGGLGFPVFATLFTRRAWRRPHRVSLHARLALVTTIALLVGGTLLFAVMEWTGAVGGMPWPTRLLASAFLATTARTVGFNTLETAALSPGTLWVLLILMFVGGSPGSTAGGIKTTTAATVAATLWATVRGRARVEVFRRTLPDEQVAKALAVVGVSLACIGLAVLSLLMSQSADPVGLVFEAVSAFGTVGLSTGVTPTLTAFGKIVIIATMFIGRIGPLTLGFAIAARARRASIAYPSEKVMIG